MLPRILLVAPDSDLRRSVEFALSAEGCEIISRASIGAREVPSDYDCTVLDHHAAGGDTVLAARFCRIFAPVVLLANQPIHPLSSDAFRTVVKPFLGAALTTAVRDALAVPRAPTK